MPLFKFLRMDRLRRSLRESFRKKKDHVPECSKPHQWQADESGVRDGTCSFPVKYLGCVEVFESRGMQVCEEALKMLRNSRRRSLKGVLYVTGDGLRVVDDDTKGLIVDQTIEKVSFCAPDRNHEKGFSYICRDGTTRRWMCHGFLAVKDSGERLSHAVGCAFAACLERKQKRDKECGVTMTFDPNNSTFTRMGSFRQTTLTERMQQPQPQPQPQLPQQESQEGPQTTAAAPGADSQPQQKAVHNPFAIERPHATPMMLQRQGSFRGFNQLNQTSPFKRQLSLRITDLPSNLERQQRSMSLESSEFSKPSSPVSPIPESSPVGDRQPSDTISAMCQQLARGLTLLSNTEDPFSQPFGPTPSSAPPVVTSAAPHQRTSLPPSQAFRNGGTEINPWAGAVRGSSQSRAEVWLSSNVTAVDSSALVSKSASNPGDHTGAELVSRPSSAAPPPAPPHPIVLAPPRRAPHIAHLRSQSMGAEPGRGQAAPSRTVLDPSAAPPPNSSAPVNWSSLNGAGSAAPSGAVRDPFDAEWAALAARTQPSTNPFAQNSVKAFEVHM